MKDIELSGAELAAMATAREVRSIERTLPTAVRKTAAQVGEICAANNIPLHVVLEGLHEGFDAYSAEGVWLYQAGLKSRYLGDKGLAFVDLIGTVLTIKWLSDVAAATVNGVLSLLGKLVPSFASIGESGSVAMSTLMNTVLAALPFGLGTALRGAVSTMSVTSSSSGTSGVPSAPGASGSSGATGIRTFSPSEVIGGSGTRVGTLRKVLTLSGDTVSLPVYANSVIMLTDENPTTGSTAPGPNRRTATISSAGAVDPRTNKRITDSDDFMFAINSDKSLQVIPFTAPDSSVLNDATVLNDNLGSRARSMGVLGG